MRASPSATTRCWPRSRRVRLPVSAWTATCWACARPSRTPRHARAEVARTAAPCPCGAGSALGQEPGHQRVGMAMAQLVRGLEMGYQLHVLEGACLLQHLHPMGDGLAVLLLDGREVRSRAFHGLLRCHVGSFQGLLATTIGGSADRQGPPAG